jgi:copper chaperone
MRVERVRRLYGGHPAEFAPDDAERFVLTRVPPRGILAAMTDTVTYSVPGVSCGHCRTAITEEVSAVAGVEAVDVDLEAKRVTVQGEGLDDAALRAAIDEAGYEVE